MVAIRIFAFALIFAAASAQKCELTTRDARGPFFVEGAPEGVALAPEDEMGTSKNYARVQGRVVDENCAPLANAVVDIWHAGDDANGGRYTFKPNFLWYRGKTRTDADGNYAFETVFPATYSGRPIPHYHYKVEAEGRSFVTQAYFRDLVPEDYENYVRRRGSQFAAVETLENVGRRVTFDMVMFIG